MRALLILAVGSSLLACNDGSSLPDLPKPQPTKQRAPEPVAKEKAPEPVAKKVDLSIGEGFEMRRPIVDGKLTIIPIIATNAMSTQKFISLHDGMAKNLVYVREESRRHFDAGRTSLEAAKRIDLGPYAGWTEPERLFFNVERAYRELEGQPFDAPIDVMATFRGVHALREHYAAQGR